MDTESRSCRNVYTHTTNCPTPFPFPTRTYTTTAQGNAEAQCNLSDRIDTTQWGMLTTHYYPEGNVGDPLLEYYPVGHVGAHTSHMDHVDNNIK